MLPHDEVYLRHSGVKGMHWGIRKKTQEEKIAKAEKRAQKYDKKAKEFSKRADKISDVRDRQALNSQRVMNTALSVGMPTLLATYAKKNNVPVKINKGELAADVALGLLKPTSLKQNLNFKAETARRKATRIREKSMRDTNAPRAKLTFEAAKAKTKAIMADKYNQEKAIRITKTATIVAITMYRHRKGLKVAANLAGSAALGLILKDRAQREAARSSLKALADASYDTKLDAAFKKWGGKNMDTTKFAYYIDPSGKITKEGLKL